MNKSKIYFFLLSLLLASSALANPTGGVVAAGDAVINQSAGNTVIQQSSQKAIVNWQSFNIGAGEKTHFQQPQGGITLNRINATQGPSQIYGQLTATGKIILVNQAGIFFGPGSYVNVGGLIATTSNISDSNFLAGKLIFDQPSPFNGSVINKGTIIAAQNGLVALLGNNVSNDGLIQAQQGSVVLASGKKFTVDLYGDQLVNFVVDEGITNTGTDENGVAMRDAVKNNGTIIANGGTILMTAKSAAGVVDHVINMSGVAQARSVDTKNGTIILSSDAPVSVIVTGLLDASGLEAGQRGGVVKILGKNIFMTNNAKVDVSGDQGGGEILVGGNYQGKGPELNASRTIVDSGVELNADAITNGDGGKVIVWADEDTYAYGNITARGGALSGNGGFVETSGHYLDANKISVNLSAVNGQTGTWLLDPYDVTINSSGSTSGGSFSGGNPNTFTPTADSIVDTSNLQANLNSANVVITTAGAGTSDGNITIDDPILPWSTANSLTLQAVNNITMNANVATGAVGSNIIFDAGGSITQPGGFISGAGGVTITSTTSTGVIATFTQPNTYTGGTNVYVGTLQVNNDSALGTGYAAVISGAELLLNGVTLNNNLVISGNGLICTSCVTGAIATTGSTTSTINGNITLTGDSLIVPNAGTTFKTTGSIDGATYNAFSLTILGDGNVDLASVGSIARLKNLAVSTAGSIDINNVYTTGFQTYLGSIVSAHGSTLHSLLTGDILFSSPLILDSDLTIGAANGSIQLMSVDGTHNLTLIAAGAVNLYGNIGSTTALNNVAVDNTTPTVLGADVSIRGAAITLAGVNGGGYDLTIDNSDTSSISGILSGTNTVLNKLGTGTLTLSGVNSYSGATSIYNGTLAINSNNAINTSSAIYIAPITSNTAILNTNALISLTYNNPIYFDSSASGSVAQLTNNAGTLNLGGVITVKGDNNTLTTNNVTLTGGIDSNALTPGSLTLTSSRSLAINSDVGSIHPLNNFAVTVTGNTSDGGTHNIVLGNNVTATGTVTLNSAYNVLQTGSAIITADALSISSKTGASLINDNAISNYLSINNNTSGIISFTNISSLLTLNGLTNVGPGSINVSNSGALTSNAAISSSGNITLTASTGTLTIDSTIDSTINSGTGSIILNALGGGDVILNANATSHDITISADRDATLNADITASRDLNVYANRDITLNAGTMTASDYVDVEAGRNITLYNGSINAIGNQYYNGVYLGAATGFIAETGTGVINTLSSLGTGSATGTTLTTENNVYTFYADNSTSGAIELVNPASLTVYGINQVGGGDVTITSDNPIYVYGPIAGGTSNVTIDSGELPIELGGDITTTGSVLLKGIDLFDDSTVNAGNITVNGGISGSYDLSLFATNVTITGSIGSNNVTVTGVSGNNTLSLQNGSDQNWILSDVNTGTVAGLGLSGTFNFSSIQNIVAGSGNNSITGSDTTNTWNIIGSNSGTVTGLAFSGINALTGGASNDTFNLGNGIVFAGSIDGGLGTNTLVGANAANTWNIASLNTGSVTGLSGSFLEMQNLIGGSLGKNIFNFASGAAISGSVDGGNTTSINEINFADNVTIHLQSLITGDVTDTNTTANIVSFNNIQQARGLGAVSNLYIPTGKTYTVTYYDATKTNGEVGDPFYFFNMFVINPPVPPSPPAPTPTPTPTADTTTNVYNVIASVTQTTNGLTDDTATTTNDAAVITAVNDNLDQVIEQTLKVNVQAETATTFGCFSVH